jgi:hypothetical protein
MHATIPSHLVSLHDPTSCLACLHPTSSSALPSPATTPGISTEEVVEKPFFLSLLAAAATGISGGSVGNAGGTDLKRTGSSSSERWGFFKGVEGVSVLMDKLRRPLTCASGPISFISFSCLLCIC